MTYVIGGTIITAMETCCSRFTAAEGGARLSAVASVKNIIITEHCSFVATRLLHEDAYKIRGLLSEGRKRSVYVTRASRVAYVAYELNILTDLSVAQSIKYEDVEDWKGQLESKEVIVCTSGVLRRVLEEELLTIPILNVLIIDSCHLISTDGDLKYIMKLYKECGETDRPRLLALTYPLFASINKDEERIEDTDEISDRREDNKSDVGSDETDIATSSQSNVDNPSDELDKLDKAVIDDEKKESTEESSVAFSKIDNTRDDTDGNDAVEKSISDNVGLQCKNSEDIIDLNSYNQNVSKNRGYGMGVYRNVDDFEMYEKLGWKIEELERDLCCDIDLAEDIDGAKRLSGTDALDFMNEHRYDPSEIYGEDLYEEFVNIPDPTKEPKELFSQFLYILDELGPYAADKAAFALLAKLEKLKIKVPYERHFLLLCMCTSLLVKIRGYADYVFSKCSSDWEKIEAFCTPKVLRFAEILERFRPPETERAEAVETAGAETERTVTERGETRRAQTLETADRVERADIEADIAENIETAERLEVNTESAVANNQETENIENERGESLGKMERIERPEIDIAATDRGEIEKAEKEEVAENERPVTQKAETTEGDKPEKVHVVGNVVCVETDKAETLEGIKGEQNTAVRIKRLLDTIEDCDFTTLGDRIEDRVNTYAANLKELEDAPEQDGDSGASERDSSKQCTSESDDLKGSVKELGEAPERDGDICASGRESGPVKFGARRRELKCDDLKGVARRQRTRGRTRASRGQARVQQAQLSPDALCGIMFVREPLMAKILFMLIVDMSRSRPGLGYVCAQYCAAEATSAGANEIQECQRQNKKQEDVLKKFRMHECNLLLATSVLEEGIDLPRCNLVIRWDLPPSYRSHALCRSRARAPRAALTLMAESPSCSRMLLHHLAIYRELDQIITRKCGCGIQDEPPPEEEIHADDLTPVIKAYCPTSVRLAELADSSLKRADLIKLSRKQLEQLLRALSKRRNNRNPYCNSPSEVLPIYNNEKMTEICGEAMAMNTDNMSEIANSKEVTEEIGSKEESHRISILNFPKVEDADAKIVDDLSIMNNTILQLIGQFEDVSIESGDSVDIRNADSGRDCDRNDGLSKLEASVNQCFESLRLNKELNGFDSRKEGCVRKSDSDTLASVDLSTAIALINRYCGKLPSDTFTRLAPQWWMEEVELPDRHGNMRQAYICTLRLPLNCPVKYNIVGHPMPTRVLARRMVALQACRILHKSGELDNQLMPIGKENFKAAELDTVGGVGGSGGVGGGIDAGDAGDSARPGTTKRRQYYYKRTAWAFTDCQPVVDATDADLEAPLSLRLWEESRRDLTPGTKRNTLYAIESRLWCALPERYNTRGRRLHAPQHASQAIGILMARHRPDKLQIPAFPVYTRSGEVRVSVELAAEADTRLSPRRARLVRRFMRFVFADVLRVRRRGMKLQSDGSAHNNYYVVPTIKVVKEDGTSKVDVDWAFLELIYKHTEEKKNLEVERPNLFQQEDEEEDDEGGGEERQRAREKEEKSKKMENPLLKPGETFVFDAEKYNDAVVTPWYRNRDQPQFFLVAEICWNLSPDSAFPSATHTTFRDYYSSKYGVTLTQPHQPLLDVDHTSARLNLLTPRYVNRKGVALPVSSERTRRAKRDRLDQKQILVPELCRVHPFAAPLWFATVALPCVLYRINALLIADEIRRAVAVDVGLGEPDIDEAARPGFQWPPLDFGWSLAEVLSADSEKGEKRKEDDEEEDSDGQKRREVRAIEGNKEAAAEGDAEEKKELKEKTINDILQEKEDAENGFEIGTWSNDMASSIPEPLEYDEFLEPLPANLTFCTSASGGANWSEPMEKPKLQYGASRTFSVADSDCSYMSSDFDTDDSDLNSDGSYEDPDSGGFCSSKNSNAAMGVRIEYKTAHEAEAVDVVRARSGPPPPQPCRADDALDLRRHRASLRAASPPPEYIEQFRESVKRHEAEIVERGLLLEASRPVSDLLPGPSEKSRERKRSTEKLREIEEIFPYGAREIEFEGGQVTLESVERNKRLLLSELEKRLPKEEKKRMSCFSMKDVDIDSPRYVNEKLANVGFDSKECYRERVGTWREGSEFRPYYQDGKVQSGKPFDFDHQPDLEGHPGPSPSVILQALTMSNANDGINLERLETIGDSFLKFAITAYLYCAHPTVHEGKLSHMRSKQVSNLNLYRLGRSKRLGARMTASKFEPHDNWLPPCHRAPPTLHTRPPEGPDHLPIADGTVDNAGCFIPYNLITQHSIPDKSIADCVEALIGAYLLECGPRGALLFMSWLGIRVLPRHDLPLPEGHPYVQAHMEGGPDAAAPVAEEKCPSPKRERRSSASESESEWNEESEGEGEEGEGAPGGGEAWTQDGGPEPDWGWPGRAVGSLRPYCKGGRWYQPIFGALKAPPSPLLRYIEDPEGELEQMLSGYEALERTLQYRFRDRSLLLQALTHASHQRNRLTDCYQRLEFLGDAILDYLITRHLYEDARRHSPGALTDLRSALVNNTIFATLAARHGFHKYFRHMSPGLNEVLTKYVKIQEENGHSISEEHYLIYEDEMEQAEDVEVPKALGDLFESVAGAIFLDSGMSLGAVWRSYVRLMGAELEAFSAAAPKSPVRELLEAEPDTAKFGKPERLADGRRVRVCVEVFGRGAFKGVGRNYRIAKGTAARCALRHLRVHRPR
ncbi:unnamed protein product, partial [Iphiclides podalirius]